MQAGGCTSPLPGSGRPCKVAPVPFEIPTNMDPQLLPLLTRIADALERLAPTAAPPVDLAPADAFVWHAEGQRLTPIPTVSRVDLALLAGIERQRDTLLENTSRFAAGLPANNALLWGARGMGKSSLVKAVHATVNAETRCGL